MQQVTAGRHWILHVLRGEVHGPHSAAHLIQHFARLTLRMQDLAGGSVVDPVRAEPIACRYGGYRRDDHALPFARPENMPDEILGEPPLTVLVLGDERLRAPDPVGKHSLR